MEFGPFLATLYMIDFSQNNHGVVIPNNHPVH